MIKQYILLMFLLTILKSYCNDFTHEELTTIKMRLELYPLHTNIIYQQEQEIQNLYDVLDNTYYKDRRKRRIILLTGGSFTVLSFIAGFVVGIKY